MNYTKERKQQVLESSYYPVKIVEHEDHNLLVDARPEYRNRVISKVSKNYELVENERVIQPFVEKFGVDNLSSVIRNGDSITYEIKTGRNLEIVPGDSVEEKLIVQNSYNKTRSFAFMFGAFRFVCCNGLYTGQAFITFKQKHMGEIPINSIISEGLNSYENNNFDLWRAFADANLTLDQQKELVHGFRAFQPKEEQDIYELKPWELKASNKDNYYINKVANKRLEHDHSLDNQRNAWGLYNQLNWAINHVTPNKQVSKKITANKRVEEYLQAELNVG